MSRCLAVLLLTASPALAENCGPHKDVIAALAEKYGEQGLGGGIVVVGAEVTSIVEVYRSEETGSWTILSTEPNGLTCILAAGEVWQAAEPAPVGEPL